MSEELAGNRPREAPARKGRDVFISYSRHDRQVAEDVCAALESAGISCWIGPRDTQAGAYGRSIMGAIHSARMLVLILSENADKTPNVLTEVAEAFDSKLPLLPFRLSNFAASPEMRFYIRTQHWIDAFPGPVERHLPALIARVDDVLRPGAESAPGRAEQAEAHRGRSPADATPAMDTVPVPRTRAGAHYFGRYWLWAALAILIMGFAAGAAAVKPWTWFQEPAQPIPPPDAPPAEASPGMHCIVGDCWGAVAFGPGRAWAYSLNYASRATASNAADKRCGGRCTNVLTFHNSCGAYARGRDAYGWGNGPSKELAQQRALTECRDRAKECEIIVWGCTTR